jgi:hypothetical protein
MYVFHPFHIKTLYCQKRNGAVLKTNQIIHSADGDYAEDAANVLPIN